MDSFIDWLQSYGAHLDNSALRIIDFPLSEGGRGTIALRDIPEGHTLFTIPRALTLSTRTSQLPVRFGLDAWQQAGLHQGWAGLILCMMWEQANGPSSKWQGYLDILPDKFDTPMFWSEDDLTELKGTSVVEKLGKVDAEVDYTTKLLPAVKLRPDLFRSEDLPTQYSLEVYHIMGSRILSRSFAVEKWDGDEDEDDDAGTIGNGGTDSTVKVDQNFEDPDLDLDDGDGVSGNSDGEDEDDSSYVAMVPMADILNARYQTENAKLFYEKEVLKMMSTRPIKSGEQIWNTYGDLPNAELLRRYGHIDVLLLPSGEFGNPGDVVEIKADLIVSVIRSHTEAVKDDQVKERIDWWLEEGGEDVFILDYEFEVPSAMISFAKLLLSSEREWEKVREKSKPPKPKLEGPLYDILILVIKRRLAEYPTTLEADRTLLHDSLPLNKRQALIVRIGEKDILHGSLGKLKDAEVDRSGIAEGFKKRKAGSSDTSAKEKKPRR